MLKTYTKENWDREEYILGYVERAIMKQNEQFIKEKLPKKARLAVLEIWFEETVVPKANDLADMIEMGFEMGTGEVSII